MSITVFCPFCYEHYAMVDFYEVLCPNCGRNELVVDRRSMEPKVNLHTFLDR